MFLPAIVQFSVFSGLVVAIAGAHNIDSQEDSQQGIRTMFTNHEEYNPDTIQNDISLLTFQYHFTLNEYVVPIALPPAQTDEWMLSGDPVRVCGWGNINWPGNTMPAQAELFNHHLNLNPFAVSEVFDPASPFMG